MFLFMSKSLMMAANFVTSRGRVFRVDQVPEHFKEHFILAGYRSPPSSPKQCLLSAFYATNETLNFWTHFLPALYFIWWLIDLWPELKFVEDEYSYPMLAYMLSVCLFPAMSAYAHIFNAMSDSARHICFFIDYFALSFYSLGAAVAYRAYSMPCSVTEGFYAKYYLLMALILSILCMLFSCFTRYNRTLRFRRILRLLCFVIPYFFDCMPVLYRLIWSAHPFDLSTGNFYHWRQQFFAITSAFLYSSKIPERFSPGSFDIIGHSHQLFHICGVFGTNDQMIAILYDLRERRKFLQDANNPHFPTFHESIGLILLLGLMNIIILLFFCRKVKEKYERYNNNVTKHE